MMSQKSTPILHQSSHWDDPNVIAHLRMKDRVGSEGENILHLEEIQSDWGQEGRKNGFNTAPDPKEIAALKQKFEDSNSNLVDVMFKLGTNSPEYKEANAAHQILANRLTELNRTDANAVKSAPYVEKTGDWTDLALKRALKEAADNGHDIVTWSPGEVNAAHYPNGDQGMGEGMKGFYDRIVPAQMQKLIKKLDPAAKVETHQVPIDIPPEWDFKKYIKTLTRDSDLADQAASWEMNKDSHFYNRESNAAKAKKDAEKFGQLHEDFLNKPYYLQPMQGVRMTDKMRAAIKKGLPAYKRGGAV